MSNPLQMSLTGRYAHSAYPIFLAIMKFVLSLAIIFQVTTSSAFASTTDPQVSKIQGQLVQLPEFDKQRLPLIIELVSLLRRSDPELALSLVEQGKSILEQHPNAAHEALLVGYVTKIYLERGELVIAENLIEQGIAAGRQADNAEGLSINLFNRALLYHLSNKLVLAINSYKALEQAYLAENNKSGLAAAYNNMGNVYRIMGNLDDALAHYQKALPYYEGAKNRTHYANTVMNIGQLFFLINDVEQAELNYLKGLEAISRDSAPLSYSEGHQRLGIMYRELGRLEQSREHFILALEVAEQKDLQSAQLSIHFELIKVAAKSEDETLLSNSLSAAEALISPNTHSATKSSIYYFRALVAFIKDQLALAEQNIDLLFAAQSYQSRYFEMQEALDLAVEIKSGLGNYVEANQLISESFSRYQNQQEESRSSLIAQYAQLYKTNEKEKEVARLQKLNIQQEFERLQAQQETRLMTFIFVVAFLLVVATVIVIWQRSRNLVRENQLNTQLMNEKKQFFADISHELRTPLTVFKLKMEELEYGVADDPKSVFALLYERIEGFNHLINDISELAKSDQGELELDYQSVDLLPFFSRRQDELVTLAKQCNLEVEIDIQLDEEATGSFDTDRIRQVLNNLFSNSCRYTQSPGSVRFSVFTREGKLSIAVEDSAPGMSSEQLEHAFDRLYRADRSRSRKLGGSGLGLSICQGLIQAHKGEITVEPSQLGGVKFSIELPLG